MARFVEIMLVEDEPEVREGFRRVLAFHPVMSLVYETDSEQQALNYLAFHEVDVLILDIELAEGDGLSLLYEIEARGQSGLFIIVVTNTGSHITLGCMRAHGADYIYRKTNRTYSPQKVLSVIEKICPYQKLENKKQILHTASSASLAHQKSEDQIMLGYIESELEKMGFRRRQVGFTYTVEAIFLLIMDPEGSSQPSGDVYESIAREHHTTRESVEHGIRNAIESVFTGAHVGCLHRYYPFDYDNELGRPANAEFLKNMAERLKL